MKYLIIFIIATTTSVYAKNEGRYQVKQLGDMRRDQYLIDTITGKMWRPVCQSSNDKGECAYLAWTKVDIEDITKSGKEILDFSKFVDKNK